MNCSEFEQRLERAFEAHGPTASEQAALAEHLASCPTPSCRRLGNEAALLTRTVRSWQEDVPEIDLADRVLGDLREAVNIGRALQSVPPLQARYALVREPSPARSAERPAAPRWGSMMMLAAALLLVLSVLTLRSPTRPEVASSNAPAPNSAAGVRSPQQDPPPASGGEPRGQLAGSYAAMPLSATQFLTDAVVLVVPADLSDPEDEASPTEAWAQRLEKRWEPIGRELNRSLEVLIQVLPRSESAS
jgi:hypothetical protein